jgi:hypothetical protein
MNVTKSTCVVAARLVAASGFVALLLGSGSASAATQMFKCIIGGRTVYQQQACPADAELPMAPGISPGSPATPASAASQPAASKSKVKPASRPASSVPATPR